MKPIRVSFLNAEAGTCFAQAELPSAQLPDSFEAHTTVQLEGQDWEIVQAEPMTRAEYEQTGELRLRLRPIHIEAVDPGNLLFSLPTICDVLPGIAPGSSKLKRRVLELHEDDWRQVELVCRSQQGEIEAGLAQIRRIYTDARTAEGFFRELHVRKEVARPLEGCRLTVNDVGRYFGSWTRLEGLAYRDVAGLVEGGFAGVSAAGLCLYGVASSAAVVTLGLQLANLQPQLQHEVSSLTRLMRDHQLSLVDWCRVQQIQGEEEELTRYLTTWCRGG
jgi:hypothetical protein